MVGSNGVKFARRARMDDSSLPDRRLAPAPVLSRSVALYIELDLWHSTSLRHGLLGKTHRFGLG